MNDVLERIRKAETMPLDADGKVALWETLQDALAEIKRLRITDAEREALEVALHWCSPYPYRKEAKAIRRFLDRTADCATSTREGRDE